MVVTRTNTSSYVERTIDKKTYKLLKNSDGRLTSTIDNNVVFQNIPSELFEDAKSMPDDMFLNIFFKDSTLRQEYYRLKESVKGGNKNIIYGVVRESPDYHDWISLRFVGSMNKKRLYEIRFEIGTEGSKKSDFGVALNITDYERITNYMFNGYRQFSYTTFQQYEKLIDSKLDVNNIEYLEYVMLGLMTNILGDYIKAPEKVCKESFKTSKIVITIISILSLILAIALIFWRSSVKKVRALELAKELSKDSSK